MRLAEDFQEWRGVNVKTNDSGYKEYGRKEGELEERTFRGDAVTRVVAATRTMTISFYFPHSFVSLAQTSNFYFLRRVFAISSLVILESPRGAIHWRMEVYLNVFRDRAICPYCSAFLSGFISLRAASDSSVIYSH